MKYRKKPVVIDAWRFENALLDDAPDWVIEKASPRESDDGSPTLVIPTLEGEMIASWGDWVIRGVKGEIYPCKPDIFEQTYEAA